MGGNPVRVYVRVMLLLLALAVASCATLKQTGDLKSDLEMEAYGVVPAGDPARKISEEDCTKPLTADNGNLRCK